MSLFAEFVSKQKAKDEFDAARKVVRRHFAAAHRTPNVDLYKLAEGKGITVRPDAGMKYEGMIERDADGVATISIRRGLNRPRERFTLAHELGHWLLQEELIGTMKGKLFRGVSRNPKEVQEEERLASLLAAELLMPFDLLQAGFDAERPLRSLTVICKQFGVSRMAAVRRVADVCNKNYLLLQLVPFKFFDLHTLAEVDDAVFASARQATLFDRNRTRLRQRLPFESIIRQATTRLRLRTPKGEIDEQFEVIFRQTPIPHAFALTSIAQWPNQGRKDS